MARPVAAKGRGRTAKGGAETSLAPAQGTDGDVSLTREQRLELYYWMRLTRSLEERLVNLYRQTKVVGGLFPNDADGVP